jgi:hypothetical protein
MHFKCFEHTVKEKVRTQLEVLNDVTSSEKTQAGAFGKYGILDFKGVSAGFLLGSPLGHIDGCNICLRNVGLCPKCTALQSISPRCSQSPCENSQT